MAKLDKTNIQDILALTPLQDGMLFHYLKETKSDLYFEQLCLILSGKIEPTLFEKAWNIVIAANEMLRTAFRWEGLENSIQIILKEYYLKPEFYDFTGKSKEEIGQLVEAVKKSEREKISILQEQVPFSVALCKIEKDRYEMIISNHHILYDGWSNGIILKEFFHSYSVFSAAKEPLVPIKVKFKEFVKWLQDRDKEKQAEFWKEYLYGFDTQTELSIKKRSRRETITVGNFQSCIQKLNRDEIEDFCKAYKITAAALFYSSWGLLLQKYNDSEDVVFGTTVSGRPAEIQGIENMVGLFINTIPLRLRAAGDEKIIDLLHRVNDILKERESYENTSLVDIKEYSALGVQEELFDNIVVIENYPLEKALSDGKTGGLTINSYSISENTHYDLTLGITLFAEIEINVTYRAELFEESGIPALAGHFCRIVHYILANPGKAISQIEMLSTDEKNRLLYEWNNTEVFFPQYKTIHQLFMEQAERIPDRVGLVGYVGHVRPVGQVGQVGPVMLTYRKLNEQSDLVAWLLIERGVLLNSIVGIMIERSIEMAIGIFGVLKAGAAYLPIDRDYPQERIQYMLKDSNAKIVLGMEGCRNEIIVNGQLLIVNCELKSLPKAPSQNSSVIVHQSSHLAYIIYTSGTTGKPKGVMINHSSLLNRIFWVKERYRLNERDVILQATSIFFDVSVCEMFRWIPAGGRLCLLPAGAEKEPVQIVETIYKYGVTTADIVPPMLNLILEYVERDKTYNYLSSLRWVFTGVEAVGLTLVKRFNEVLYRLNKTRLINAYGPTEATVDVTYFDCSEIGGVNEDIIPIGRPMANIKVYILDRNGRLQAAGIPGELCITGAGLARGYLNNPELTADRFNRSDRSNRTYILYKTGDLARWLDNGNIEFLGRIDLQVKIRGFRVELGEIEDRLLKHADIREAVVIAWESGHNEKYLCAYIVPCVAGTDNISRWREYLQQILPGYMVPAHFVLLEKIPLTATGKIDRKSLPRPEANAAGEYSAPRNEVEKKLVDIWSEILEIDSQKIGIDANFFELGGHSLKATTLVLRIHKVFHVNIPLSRVFQLATIRTLAESIAGAAFDRYISIEPAEKKEYYVLSPAQKRLYILQQMEETRTSYNMFHAIVLNGDISKEIFENILKKLIQRHEVLRTSFEMRGKEPVQRIHDDVEFELEIFGSREEERLANVFGSPETFFQKGFWPPEANIKHFIRPFDLSKAPLLRAGLIKDTDKRYILVLDMHHIAVDGTSVGIFIDDFIKLYSGAQLPPVKLQYKDFSEWQRKWADSGGLESQEEYWLKKFEGDIPLLNLPFDYERPVEQTFDFDRVVFEADRELSARIKKLAAETGATLYMVLLAAYCILLAKYGDQEDIVIGTGVVGRTHPDTEQIVGMFVNMLALRSYPSESKTLGLFLEEMKGCVLSAFENQDYPFDELVKKLSLKREYGRNPLFDTEFTFHDAGDSAIEIPGLKVEPFEYENSLLKFDLSLTAFEADEKIHLVLGFSPRLFKRPTIEAMAKHFLELLEQFPGNKDRALKELKTMVNGRLATAETVFSRSDYSGFEF
jgi:tyrocidine synthetase-3